MALTAYVTQTLYITDYSEKGSDSPGGREALRDGGRVKPRIWVFCLLSQSSSRHVGLPLPRPGLCQCPLHWAQAEAQQIWNWETGILVPQRRRMARTFGFLWSMWLYKMESTCPLKEQMIHKHILLIYTNPSLLLQKRLIGRVLKRGQLWRPVPMTATAWNDGKSSGMGVRRPLAFALPLTSITKSQSHTACLSISHHANEWVTSLPHGDTGEQNGGNGGQTTL